MSIRIAPWNDFKGNTIFEGCTIVHPSGQSGVVRFRGDRQHQSDQWVVDYGDGSFESRLVLQIGQKGRAVIQGSQ